MTSELRGPGGRYTVSIQLLTPAAGPPTERQRTTTGTAFQGAGSSPYGYLVALDGCSLVLIPGERGLTVRDLKLKARHATVTAVVKVGSGAPAWMPTESTYVLFSGDRSAAAAVTERYVPFGGPNPPPHQQVGYQQGQAGTALDQLAVAIGRAVARANADLSQASTGMTAVIARVTVRVAVERTDLNQGEVQLVLGRTPAAGAGQFVEFDVAAVPAPHGSTQPQRAFTEEAVGEAPSDGAVPPTDPPKGGHQVDESP